MALSKVRKALIISQETFEDPKVEERTGNIHDVQKLEEALNLCGFSVRMIKDRKKDDILSSLYSFTVEDHSNLQCIVVIVLTHGNRGGILLAKDKNFYTKDVWGPFRDCDEFKDIPKVFIFQACRGGNEEKTFRSHSTTEEPSQHKVMHVVPVLPHKPGFLLVHSTIEDHTSKRYHQTGSVFIQTLCNELVTSHNKHGEINFLSMLTEVNNTVTIYGTGENASQTSTFVSFLRHPLVLRTNAIPEVKSITSSTSDVSNDAAGGVIMENSYEDKGTRLILTLYTEKYKNQVEKMKGMLSHSHFTVHSILLNDDEDIKRLSSSYDFENTGSLMVFVLADITETIMDHCEKIFIKLSTTEIHLSDVWCQFTASRCLRLRRKPKLFFFCDFLGRDDSDEKNTKNNAPLIQSVNNHSDFLWTYCYGEKIFEKLVSALLFSEEEISQLLTTAMSEADESTCRTVKKISYFESTLRQQFYCNPRPQQRSLNLQEEMTDMNAATPEDNTMENDASASSSQLSDICLEEASMHSTQSTKEHKLGQLLVEKSPIKDVEPQQDRRPGDGLQRNTSMPNSAGEERWRPYTYVCEFCSVCWLHFRNSHLLYWTVISTIVIMSIVFTRGGYQLATPDLQVTLQDGNIRCHSNILGNSSPKLAKMLRRNQHEIELPGVKTNTFEILLQLIYKGEADEVKNDIEKILDVANVAHELKIYAAVTYCTEMLRELLNPTNVCSILDLAGLLDDVQLTEACTKVIREETDKVLKSDGFLKCNVATLEHILKQEVVHDVTELDLFQATVRWAKTHENSSQALGSCLGLIRFRTFAVEDVDAYVKPEELITDKDKLVLLLCLSFKDKCEMPAGFSNEMSKRHTTWSVEHISSRTEQIRIFGNDDKYVTNEEINATPPLRISVNEDAFLIGVKPWSGREGKIEGDQYMEDVAVKLKDDKGTLISTATFRGEVEYSTWYDVKFPHAVVLRADVTYELHSTHNVSDVKHRIGNRSKQVFNSKTSLKINVLEEQYSLISRLIIAPKGV